MTLLFDSSAIFEAIKLGNKAVDLVKGNYTVDLTRYELGNIIWKFRGRVSVDDLFSAVSRLLSWMEVIELGLDKEVLSEAVKRNLTYYDAAYLVAARRLNATLVSEDKDLIREGAVRLKDVMV
mgnify:FL=1